MQRCQYKGERSSSWVTNYHKPWPCGGIFVFPTWVEAPLNLSTPHNLLRNQILHLICIVSSSLSSPNHTDETIFCALSTSFHAPLWPCCDVCHQLGPCCIMASWLISSIPRQLSSTVMFPSDLVPRSDNIQHLVCGLLSANSQPEPRVFPWLLSSNHPTGLRLFCQTLQHGQNTSPITIYAARRRQKWHTTKVQEAWDTLRFLMFFKGSTIAIDL